MITLRSKDAADFAHDHGAGEQSIITAIEGEDPSVARLLDADLRLAGAVLEMVRKLIVPGEALQTSQRFMALCLHLAPDVLGLTMKRAAEGMRITRASLCRHTKIVGKEWGLGHARWRKTHGAQGKYQAAQHRAVAAGRHSSFTRKDRPKKDAPAPNGG